MLSLMHWGTRTQRSQGHPFRRNFSALSMIDSRMEEWRVTIVTGRCEPWVLLYFYPLNGNLKHWEKIYYITEGLRNL